MRNLRPGTIALMVSIILWGTLLGGIAYSHVVYFPVYLSALPDSAILVTGPYGLKESRFWLTIHPLIIISLIVALILNWRLRARRRLILITAVTYALTIAVTTVYFVPELMAFETSAASSVPAAEWLARGQRWQALSLVRGLFCYAAIVPLLIALTKLDPVSVDT